MIRQSLPSLDIGRMIAASLFLFLFVTMLGEVENQCSIVKVRQGDVCGKEEMSAKGRKYVSFQGIPYAAPPVGPYRFMESGKPEPWAGVWNATRTLSVCLQYDPFHKEVMGQEDCLYLNVYTPQLREGAALPVLFFIHGGAFMFGTANIYGPQRIMDLDLVVVTINYRLGPLGFLSTGDTVVPGNAGLKDQYNALRWVKDNIKVFGGNPDNVILYGNSAGSASVQYQFTSPRQINHNLFARGFFSSGSAFAPWAFQDEPGRNAEVLASLVGCPTSDTQEMVNCLQKRPGHMIANAQTDMFGWRRASLFTLFTPTVEPEGTVDPLVAADPYLSMAIGNFSKPILASVTSQEGLYPAAYYQSDPTLLPELNEFWPRLASTEYMYTLPLARRDQVAAIIKEYYFNNRPIDDETYPQLVQSLGDRLFYTNIGKFLKMAALESSLPIHLFRYSFRGEKSLSNLIGLNNKDYGVSHSDDLFRIFVIPNFELNRPDELAIIDVLLKIIYKFSTDGLNSSHICLPTNDIESESGTEKEVNIEWIPVDGCSEELNLLEISSPTDFKMKRVKNFGNASFWDSLGLTKGREY